MLKSQTQWPQTKQIQLATVLATVKEKKKKKLLKA